MLRREWRRTSRTFAAALIAGIAAALVAALVLLLVAAPVGAQQVVTSRADPEVRLDATFGRNGAAELGAGVQFPAGVYSRVGVIAAAGYLRPFRTDSYYAANDYPTGRDRFTGRLDVLARFLLDPYRQSALGLSAGAGLTLRAIPDDRVRPRLLVAIDVEGRRRANGLVPALQIGLGDGLRVSGVLRRGSLRAR